MKQGNFENEEFIRVGTTLYKLVNQPRLNGGYVKKRIVWNNETLRQDYGKDYLATVPKYDGFCTVPDHVDYRPVVDKFLNLYEPIGHRPQQGEFPCIRSLVRHIFGEQYELGMDYLQLLYLQPVQKLPILLLVSEERNTGKSTFLNFPESCVSKQCHFQYQRGLPQPVQFRLGRKTAHRGGRGIAQPQGGQRAVEEPQHHTFLQGGSQRQRP